MGAAAAIHRTAWIHHGWNTPSDSEGAWKCGITDDDIADATRRIKQVDPHGTGLAPAMTALVPFPPYQGNQLETGWFTSYRHVIESFDDHGGLNDWKPLSRGAARCVLLAAHRAGVSMYKGLFEHISRLKDVDEVYLHALLDVTQFRFASVDLNHAMVHWCVSSAVLERIVQRMDEVQLGYAFPFRDAIYACVMKSKPAGILALIPRVNDDGTGVQILGRYDRDAASAVEYGDALLSQKLGLPTTALGCWRSVRDAVLYVTSRVSRYHTEFPTTLRLAVSVELSSIADLLATIRAYAIVEPFDATHRWWDYCAEGDEADTADVATALADNNIDISDEIATLSAFAAAADDDEDDVSAPSVFN